MISESVKGVKNATIETDAHSLLVKWDPPPGGGILGYELNCALLDSYLAIDGDEDEPVIIEDGDVTTYAFTELMPSTEYVVEIFALKENWKSDMVQLTATTGKCFFIVEVHGGYS